MEKDVTLTTKDGHVEKAPSAKIDLKTNNLSRAQGVEGNGALGSLVASEFSIRDHGIFLTGTSSLVISMK